MHLKEVECKAVDLFNLVQDRKKCWAFVNKVTNLRFP